MNEQALNHLSDCVDARNEAAKARDVWRNPKETLAFFGIQPEFCVAEVMPGEGLWYTDVLTRYLADKGRYAAINFSMDIIGALLPENDPRLAYFNDFGTIFPSLIQQRLGVNLQQSPLIGDFSASFVEDAKGQLDAILFIRELHAYFLHPSFLPHLASNIAQSYDLLKAGGVVGVVQHRICEDAPDDAVSIGAGGYLKQSFVISAFEQAGFVLEETSEINANPKDKPLEESLSEGVKPLVWRLPPSYRYKDRDKALFSAVGESDRMTLRFRKPR